MNIDCNRLWSLFILIDGARGPRENLNRESIENGKMIGIEKYEIKNENIYYYIKKGLKANFIVFKT